MRIGLYTPQYPGLTGDGGIGTHTRALARGLAALGHVVRVLTPGDGPPADDGPVRVQFTRTRHLPGLDRLAPGAGACVRVARAAARLAREAKLDLFEFPNWEGHGLLFARLAGTPAVVRLYTSSRESQAIDGGPATRWGRWDVWRERAVARAADAVVTHSDAHRRRMSEETGLPADRIRLVPLGVDVFPDWVRPPRPPGPPTAVFLGRLEHRKGSAELLQAVPRVLERVPDARFVLIGTDRPHAPGGRTHAEFLAEDFPPAVRERVTLAGRLPQPAVDRWLQTADVFVAPSRYESFGLIFLEAMRWGTPVIGTTAGGIPEVVEDGASGLLVPPGSPDALADALARLFADRGLAARLGAAGRRRAEAEFAVGTMARRMAALYEETVAARRGRR
jgi:glycosyltransferase involved in cell wall biosynthesis